MQSTQLEINPAALIRESGSGNRLDMVTRFARARALHEAGQRLGVRKLRLLIADAMSPLNDDRRDWLDKADKAMLLEWFGQQLQKRAAAGGVMP
jgi:hypothetical protein